MTIVGKVMKNLTNKNGVGENYQNYASGMFSNFLSHEVNILISYLVQSIKNIKNISGGKMFFLNLQI